MIGTVPMYDAIGYLEKDLLEITAKDFLRVVRSPRQRGRGLYDHPRRHQPPVRGGISRVTGGR